MSAKGVDRLAQLLAALYKGMDPPFADHNDLYATIDAIQQGDILWESFSVKYTGPIPETGPVPVDDGDIRSLVSISPRDL
jgi:hypothetical protein